MRGPFTRVILPGIHLSPLRRQLWTKTTSFNLNSWSFTRPSSWCSFCLNCCSSTAMWRLGFRNVKQFLIFRPKNSSAGDYPVTEWSVLRFGQPMLQTEGICFTIQHVLGRNRLGRLYRTCSSSIRCRMVRWNPGKLDSILLQELRELFRCKLRPIVRNHLFRYSVTCKQRAQNLDGFQTGHGTHGDHLQPLGIGINNKQ